MDPDPVASIAALMEQRGDHRYGLHDLSQKAHALQAAMLAEQAGCAAPLIAAALLHDIGHMVHDLGERAAEDGVDDHHEQRGHDYLIRYFGPAVTEPVRLHVAAKRWLCATEPGYFARLSPDSVLSLSLQGGPMTPAEAASFHALPSAADAVALRRFDEAAKIKDLPTPPIAHFLPHLRRCLRAAAD
jgi:phosphonate degradation associated HDIG domain protein